jgi:hypothetical protein
MASVAGFMRFRFLAVVLLLATNASTQLINATLGPRQPSEGSRSKSSNHWEDL